MSIEDESRPPMWDMWGTPVPPELLKFLEGQELYGKVNWQAYEAESDREPTNDLNDAVAAGSQIRTSGPFLADHLAESNHQVMLDLDLPTWLVPSTTPGHFHLYIKVDGGVPWKDYERLLRALVACGIIEPGYAAASLERKSTTLRLPWVRKVEQPEQAEQPLADDFGARREETF